MKMERLLKPAIDGGVPYLNQDFVTILQDNNLTCYKSFLENINDNKIIGNSGIIIRGITNVDTSFDFTNSMIYLDGDFLEPDVDLSDEEVIDGKFYLVKKNIQEKREKKVSGFVEPVLDKNYFTYQFDIPSGVSYIEIEIRNGFNYCQRYLNRLLRYQSTEFGQLQTTINKDFFDSSGLGFGDMFGFRTCNGSGGTLNSINNFFIGYSTQSEFILGDEVEITQETLNDISNLPTSYLYRNYKTLRNKGGLERITLNTENLPPHNHGGYSGIPNNKLTHYHEMQYGVWGNYSPTGARSGVSYFARSTKINTPLRYERTQTVSLSNSPLDYPLYEARREDKSQINGYSPWSTISQEEFDFVNSQKYQDLLQNQTISRRYEEGFIPTRPERKDGGDYNVEDISQHTHTIGDSSGGSAHNNLPPFQGVIYYEKINPYN